MIQLAWNDHPTMWLFLFTVLELLLFAKYSFQASLKGELLDFMKYYMDVFCETSPILIH